MKTWNGWVPIQGSGKITSVLFKDKSCESCQQICIVHMTRFADKPDETFYKCAFCNLFNGFVNQDALVVPEKKKTLKKRRIIQE